MRRYTLVSGVLLVVAGSLAAWVNGQEHAKSKMPALHFKSPAPQRIGADLYGAVPLPADSENVQAIPALPTSEEIRPVAGEGDEIGEDGSLRTARRLFGGTKSTTPQRSSSAQPKAFPGGSTSLQPPLITPPSGTTAIDEPELSPAAPPPAMEGVMSVLKKKSTNLQSSGSNAASGSAVKLSPVDGSVDATATPVTGSPTVSSRRIGAGSTKPPSIRGSEPTTQLPEPTSKTGEKPPANRTSENDQLQLQGSSSRLVVEAKGPNSVTLGKPVKYTVLAANDSDLPAQNVEIRIGIPAWVEIAGGEGTRGSARREADPAGRQWLIWSMPDLAPQAKEQLQMNLTVQQNQPFELAVLWSQKPQAISAEVAVREPQIEVRMEGPSDMLHGEQKNLTLHLHNPGTGDAENVVVEIVTAGTAANRIPVGLLAAGEQKQIPFTANASKPGPLEIRVVARAAAGLTAEAVARILVRKAELQVAIGAPPMKFAGGEVTYEVAVANVGDANAEQVTLSVALPAGAKYVGGLDGAATAGDALSLKMGNLAPNTEKVFDVRCILTQAGENRFQATAQGKGDLVANEVASTNVEALADLKLVVNEPTGPVPVGSEAQYEIRVTNRGTKSAEKVQVLVQFAQGLEPFEVVGGTAEVADGQAIFEPLVEIAPGKEVVVKVKSKVEQTGNHAFRVEVKAIDPESKLVSEGVTRCFADNAGPTRATARKPLAAPSGTLQR